MTAVYDILARFVALEEVTDAVREDLERAADAYVAAESKKYQAIPKTGPTTAPPIRAPSPVPPAPPPPLPPPPPPPAAAAVVVEVTTRDVDEFVDWIAACRERTLEDLVAQGQEPAELAAPRGARWSMHYAYNLVRLNQVPELARVLDVLRGAYALGRVEKDDAGPTPAAAVEETSERSKFRAASGGSEQAGRRLCLLTQTALEDENGVELVPSVRFESLFPAPMTDGDAEDRRYRFSVVDTEVALVDALFWVAALPKRGALALASSVDAPTIVAAYQHAVRMCDAYADRSLGKEAPKGVE